MATTEIVRKSYLQRLVSAVTQLLVGLLLFVLAFPVLFLNEGHAVRVTQTLNEIQEACVPLQSNEQILPETEGKPVYLTGSAVTEDVLRDPVFGLEVNGIRLTRHVEFYQWVEHVKSSTEKELGGSATTTSEYTYEKKWVEYPLDSREYKEFGHSNTIAVEGVDDMEEEAEHVTFGAFRLSKRQIARIGVSAALFNAADPQIITEITKWLSFFGDENIAPPARNMKPYTPKEYRIPEHLRAHTEITDSGLYIHMSPGFMDSESGKALFHDDTILGVNTTAEIGDMRIRWTYVAPEVPVSLIAVQHNDTFTPYIAKGSTHATDLIRDGEWTPDMMFADARRNNEATTWIVRLAGALMMFIGLRLLLSPLVVLGDIVPFIGTLLDMLSVGVCFLLSMVLALITIALAWLAARPVLAVCLLAAALSLLLLMRRKKAKVGEYDRAPHAEQA